MVVPRQLFMFCLCLSSSHVYSANVLVILPTNLRSHWNVFSAVIEHLSTEHNVTFYSMLNYNFHNPNITSQPITFWEQISSERSETFFKEFYITPPYKQMILYMKYFTNFNFYETIMESEAVLELMNKPNQYDLLITMNFGSEPFFKLAHIFDIPMIQICTTLCLPWTHSAIGNTYNFGHFESFITPESKNTFLERFMKFIKKVYIWLYYEYSYLPEINDKTNKYFPPGAPHIKTAVKKTEAVFENTIGAMGYSNPRIPTFVQIGGLHCKPANPLPDELEAFMQDSGNDGVIYFSLGNTITPSGLPDTMHRSIMNVFRKLPHKIIWKWKGSIENLPPNVKLSKWLPQQDILGHEKIKLFITQGGLLSLQEAAYHGVPVLLLPVISDQFTNGRIVQAQGYGLVENAIGFSEKRFHSKVIQLLTNPKYSKRMKQISEIMKDEPLNAARRLKWWTNLIARHKTSVIFPVDKNQSQISLMELDVHFTIFTGFFVISFSVIYLIYRLFYNRSIKTKSD